MRRNDPYRSSSDDGSKTSASSNQKDHQTSSPLSSKEGSSSSSRSSSDPAVTDNKQQNQQEEEEEKKDEPAPPEQETTILDPLLPSSSTSPDPLKPKKEKKPSTTIATQTTPEDDPLVPPIGFPGGQAMAMGVPQVPPPQVPPPQLLSTMEVAASIHLAQQQQEQAQFLRSMSPGYVPPPQPQPQPAPSTPTVPRQIRVPGGPKAGDPPQSPMSTTTGSTPTGSNPSPTTRAGSSPQHPGQASMSSATTTPVSLGSVGTPTSVVPPTAYRSSSYRFLDEHHLDYNLIRTMSELQQQLLYRHLQGQMPGGVAPAVPPPSGVPMSPIMAAMLAQQQQQQSQKSQSQSQSHQPSTSTDPVPGSHHQRETQESGTTVVGDGGGDDGGGAYYSWQGPGNSPVEQNPLPIPLPRSQQLPLPRSQQDKSKKEPASSQVAETGAADAAKAKKKLAAKERRAERKAAAAAEERRLREEASETVAPPKTTDSSSVSGSIAPVVPPSAIDNSSSDNTTKKMPKKKKRKNKEARPDDVVEPASTAPVEIPVEKMSKKQRKKAARDLEMNSEVAASTAAPTAGGGLPVATPAPRDVAAEMEALLFGDPIAPPPAKKKKKKPKKEKPDIGRPTHPEEDEVSEVAAPTPVLASEVEAPTSPLSALKHKKREKKAAASDGWKTIKGKPSVTQAPAPSKPKPTPAKVATKSDKSPAKNETKPLGEKKQKAKKEGVAPVGATTSSSSRTTDSATSASSDSMERELTGEVAATSTPPERPVSGASSGSSEVAAKKEAHAKPSPKSDSGRSGDSSGKASDSQTASVQAGKKGSKSASSGGSSKLQSKQKKKKDADDAEFDQLLILLKSTVKESKGAGVGKFTNTQQPRHLDATRASLHAESAQPSHPPVAGGGGPLADASAAVSPYFYPGAPKARTSGGGFRGGGNRAPPSTATSVRMQQFQFNGRVARMTQGMQDYVAQSRNVKYNSTSRVIKLQEGYELFFVPAEPSGQPQHQQQLQSSTEPHGGELVSEIESTPRMTMEQAVLNSVPPLVKAEYLHEFADACSELQDYDRAIVLAQEVINYAKQGHQNEVDQHRHHHQQGGAGAVASSTELPDTMLSTGGTKFEMLGSLVLGRSYELIVQPEQAFIALNRCLHLARYVELDQRSEAWALSHLGTVLELLGRFAEAFESYTIAQRIAEELHDKRLICEVQTNVGVALLSLGELKSSEECLGGTVAMARSLKDQTLFSRVLSNLAYLFVIIGRVDRAKEVQKLEYQSAERLGDMLLMAQGIAAVGGTHKFVGEYTEAMNCYNKELQHVTASGYRQRLGECYSNTGITQRLMGQTSKARGSHVKELEVARSLKEQLQEAKALSSLADVDRTERKYSDAVGRYLQTLRIVHDVCSGATQTHLVKVTCTEMEWRAVDGLENCFTAMGQPLRALQAADRKHISILGDELRRTEADDDGDGEEGQNDSTNKDDATSSASPLPKAVSLSFVERACELTDFDAIVEYSWQWDDTDTSFVYILRPEGGPPPVARRLTLNKEALYTLASQTSSFRLQMVGSEYDTPLLPHLLAQRAESVALHTPPEDLPQNFEEHLLVLQKTFLAPIEDLLLLVLETFQPTPQAPCPQVCFILDGVMNNIPMHALPWTLGDASSAGAGGVAEVATSRVIDHFAVSVMPSLETLKHLVVSRNAQKDGTITTIPPTQSGGSTSASPSLISVSMQHEHAGCELPRGTEEVHILPQVEARASMTDQEEMLDFLLSGTEAGAAAVSAIQKEHMAQEGAAKDLVVSTLQRAHHDKVPVMLQLPTSFDVRDEFGGALCAFVPEDPFYEYQAALKRRRMKVEIGGATATQGTDSDDTEEEADETPKNEKSKKKKKKRKQLSTAVAAHKGLTHLDLPQYQAAFSPTHNLLLSEDLCNLGDLSGIPLLVFSGFSNFVSRVIHETYIVVQKAMFVPRVASHLMVLWTPPPAAAAGDSVRASGGRTAAAAQQHLCDLVGTILQEQAEFVQKGKEKNKEEERDEDVVRVGVAELEERTETEAKTTGADEGAKVQGAENRNKEEKQKGQGTKGNGMVQCYRKAVLAAKDDGQDLYYWGRVVYSGLP